MLLLSLGIVRQVLGDIWVAKEKYAVGDGVPIPMSTSHWNAFIGAKPWPESIVSLLHGTINKNEHTSSAELFRRSPSIMYTCEVHTPLHSHRAEGLCSRQAVLHFVKM
jgi:hypothetical protein